MASVEGRTIVTVTVISKLQTMCVVEEKEDVTEDTVDEQSCPECKYM
jgi:hypothetical protein